MIGQTLGHYKIVEKLGAGGMGEVYRAEDTTLKRQVALKVLPVDLASSQERLERFQREAETLASLDHPNIVTIHTVEKADGVRFLTMQLVQGQPLSKLIPKGGMPLERIFEVGIPLADALAAAHEKGVIHRDLKPANIMVTDEGRVKVLDFGLAKLRSEGEVPEATALPTEPLTGEGRLLGTVPYMSPEQLEGRGLDARTDVFSLGIVLYELATGERPFKGDSSVSVISSILRDTPREIDSLRPEVPHHLARIIRHCLEKEPRRRYQSALDVRNELVDLKAESASGEMSPMRAPRPRFGRRKPWMTLGGAGVILAVGLAATYWALRPSGEPGEPPTEPLIGRFTNVTIDPALEMEPSLSPDGRFFVYASNAAGNWDVYFQRVGGGKAINLTEDSLEDDRQPVFSPDGESIAFRSERAGGGIYVMGATGESVRRATDHGFFPDWSPDGTKIVFSTQGTRGGWTSNWDARVWTVDLSTGQTRMVLNRSALMPAWSPSGGRLAYYGLWEPVNGETRYDLFTVSVNGGEPLPITDDRHHERSPTWSADGRHLFFVSNRSGFRDIWTVPIDHNTGEILGDPEPVTSGASIDRLSLSLDGRRILFGTQTATRELLRVPFDPDAEKVTGPPVPITPPGLQALHPSVSPDGEWIAFDSDFGRPGSRAIGVVRRDGSGLRQLTESGHRDFYALWSPDGQRLTFFSNRSGSSQAWIVNADGSGLRQLTEMPDTEFLPPIWSPDGSRLATTSLAGEMTYLFDPDKPWSEEPPVQLVGTDKTEDKFHPASWSADGRRLVGSCEPKDRENLGICLYSLDTGDYERLTEVGDSPSWLSDGQRLMFHDLGEPDPAILLLDTETGETREVMSSESLGIAPDVIERSPALSPDNRSVYIERLHVEADIRMLSFDQE